MSRGCKEVLDKLDDSTTKPVPDALKAIGMALVMKVGGASGPLYGTLFMSLGKALPVDGINRAEVCNAFGAAIQAVQARGKSEAGQKTMLDVLIPVHRALADDNTDYAALRHVAEEATAATIPMRAQKGRASFLGERSIGHVDPGARSSALMVSAVCDVMEAHQ